MDDGGLARECQMDGGSPFRAFSERERERDSLSLYMDIQRFQGPVLSFYSHPHLVFLCAVPNMGKIVSTCLLLVLQP